MFDETKSTFKRYFFLIGWFNELKEATITTKPDKTLHQGCQHCVSKKSGNFQKCLTYALLQGIGLPSHRKSYMGALFPFLSENFFAK